MLTAEEKAEFLSILEPFLSHPAVEKMKEYTQHGTVSTYAHCYAVAEACFRYAKRHAGRLDTVSLVRAAFLHDFYLYDWHERGDGSHRLHGYRHARRAMENAKRIFGISEAEAAMIFTHMWPLNLTRLPRTREAWILTLTDKRISFSETVHRRGRQTKEKETP